ncbi:reprolysin-like metallopeptidase [Flavobacterium sp. 7A]|uniref:zinc-dependent metalloprotease n=1 Tax=Flavobacterium sp. 7A TaxID=2940571 RepID=UPI0022277000|nr:zinc-dependent metalloprotease family protein [Flavobacterium sp. 7A]MCW2121122.1 subtilisin-like proprotein convertase family protein [Flavobacterium sp. 7A]
MKKYILLVLLFANHLSSFAQYHNSWTKINQEANSITNKPTNITQPERILLYQLDLTTFKQLLPLTYSKTAKASNSIIEIPNTKGTLEKFSVWENSNLEPELQEKYKDIRSYAGKGITDKNATLNISISPKGIQTIILRADSSSEFIEAYPENPALYIVFNSKTTEEGATHLTCKTEEKSLNKPTLNQTSKTTSSAKVFKTLRLALSCTAEYAIYHGGTVAGALAAMNATLTRVNAVFNRDLAVKLIIIANNEQLIFTNPKTDPYSNASDLDNWGLELQKTLTNTIGNSAYDLGHVFGASGGGGNAGCIGCVCDNPKNLDSYGKGSAYTSPGNSKPEGDAFDIDFVAHEFGHQLGANHTFSYDIEGTGVNVEPGSGSTIMGYAGVTESYDVQANSDDYYSFASILQIQTNLSTKTCPISTPIANNPPVINAGPDYTIPKGTAFILKGSGTDPEGDIITYNWEQNDSATTGASEANSLAIPTKTSGPLFRSVYPTTSPMRYMPNYDNVLSNKLTSNWESVSTVARTLHFVLTGRDNAIQGTAQTNSDETVITVNATTGPFTLTSQNTDDVSWLQGSFETITWDVNNSNTLPGSSNVNIKLSTDGGLTFTTTLAANIANNGSARIEVPNITQKNCRILIEPIDNIYYALNSKTFAIGYAVDYTCNTYTFSAPFAIPEKAAYTTRTITNPATTDIVSNIKVNVNFTHSYISDLQMDIVSPNGTTVSLFDRLCSDSNGTLDLTFDDSGSELVCGKTTLQTIVPAGNLATFNNENPEGTWTFRIRDAFTTDTGTLNSASIVICTKNYTLRQPHFGILNLLVYKNPNQGKFTLYLESDDTNEIYTQITDITGRSIVSKSFPKTLKLEETIEIPSPQSGIYFLTVTAGSKKEIRKIIVN